MKGSDVAALSQACDALLREAGADPLRMAVPLLHFRSAHPEALQAYDTTAHPQGRAEGLRRLAALLRDQLAGALVSPGIESCPANADVLFISHLTTAAQAGNAEQDAYFGDLPRRLVDAGMKPVVALIDHSAGGIPARSWNAGGEAGRGVPRILLSRRLGREAEIAGARQLRAVAKDLLGGCDHAGLRRLAARQAGTGAARQVLRIAEQVASLVARLQPRALVFTYEGHAWERLAMHRAREMRPALRCIAVHHAILAPMQHAMLRRYGPTFDPDVILAAGRPAGDWLRSAVSLADLPVDILGSPRVTKQTHEVPAGGHGSCCLFLPEGLPGESLLLARAAHALGRQRPDLQCVIRLHPLMSREALVALAPDLGSPPENVEWAPPDRSIDADTAAARWAVYRGSSAILAALADGVEPVYFGAEDPELRIDPMRGRDGPNLVARNVDELASLLSPGDIDPDTQSRGIAYARDYYMPLDHDVLIRSIGARPDQTTTPSKGRP